MNTTPKADPRIEERPEQPYVFVRRTIRMDSFAQIADRLPGIIGWLGARGAEPAGAPFFRYRVIDMAGELDLEAGVPVAAAVEGEGDIRPGVLPAGRYVTVTHVGHPDELLGVTAEVLAWARGRGLAWDMAETAQGERWGCRLESYKTDPRVQPDMAKWEVELAFRLAG